MERKWLFPLKIVGAIALLLFSGGVAVTGPTAGYETSVYGAYHPLIWVSFGMTLLVGLSLILRSAWLNGTGWRHGLVLLFSAYLVFFALPLIRGYHLYATPLSDTLYHFGITRDILSTGTAPETNYPATHLLLAPLIQMTGLELRVSQPVVAYTFFTLAVVGWFVAGRRLLGRVGGLFTLVAALPLIFLSNHFAILPWLFSLAFIPYILFAVHHWYQIQMDNRLFIILFALGSAIVFYHPITSIVALVIMIVYGCSMADFRLESAHRIGFSVTAIAIPAVFWHLSVGRAGTMLIRVVAGGTRPGAASYAGRAAEQSYTIFDLLWEFVILRWGTVVLYLGVGGLITLLIGYRLVTRSSTGIERMATGQYYVGVMFAVVLIATNFLSSSVIRLSNYALISTILLIGVGGSILVSDRRTADTTRFKHLAALGLCACLTVTMIFGGAMAYNSHTQLTQSTVAGSEWHLDHQSPKHTTQAHRMSGNIDRYIMGNQEATEGEWTFHRNLPDRQLPPNLGYGSSSSIGDGIEDTTYLVTKQTDVEWSADNPNSIRRYTQQDLAQLEQDRATNQIYTGGEFDIWLTTPNSTDS